jgi:hypothetical protein
MRIILPIFFCYILVTMSVFAQSTQGSSQSYSVNLSSGLNLIANQLDNGSNTLNEIMPVVPDGSVLYKYNNASANWSVSVYYAAIDSWVPGNIKLKPGGGAFFQAPTNFTLTFTGTPNVPVLPVTIPNSACYLLSRQTNDLGDYANIVGTTPANKTKISQWTGTGYSSSVAANGVWNTGGGAGPTAAVGESLWISGPAGGSPPATPSSLTYQGLNNIGVGQASIEVISNLSSGGQDGVGLTLVVSNLTSGGQDGVGLTIPANLTGLDVNWQNLDPSNALPVGADIEETVIGSAEDSTNGVLGTVTMTKLCDDCDASNVVMTADFNWGTTTNFGYTVQAYLNGVLVGQTTNQNGAALGTMSALPLSAGFESNPNGLSWVMGWDTNPVAMDLYEPDTSLGTPSTLSVSCNQLVITPQNLPSGITPTALQITGSQIPSITINSENESLIYQGLNDTSLGQASIEVISNLSSGGQDGVGLTLVVSNLTSGGQDGVGLTIPANLSGLNMNWLQLDPSNALPVGAFVQESIIGSTDDVTNGVLGTVTESKLCGDCDASNVVVTADFNWGTTTNFGYTAQAYLNGVLVAQTTNQNGAALGTMSALPLSAGFESSPNGLNWVMGWGTNPVAMDLYEPDTSLGTPSTLSVSCNQLVITPQNMTPTGTPTAMQVTASQVSSINMTETTISPWVLSLGSSHQNLTLQWYGAGVLQGSADLTTWTDITNASSPFSVTASPSTPSKFYRLVFRP